MRYMKSIDTNFKSQTGAVESIHLDGRVLITGRNGRGHKTAIVQAGQAALTAEVDGVPGKGSDSARSAATLIKFAPDREAPDATATATANIGDTDAPGTDRELVSRFTVRQVKGKVQDVEHVSEVEAILPRRLVAALLYGDVKTARAVMLETCALAGIGGALDLEAIADEIPAHLRAKFKDIATRMAVKHGVAAVLGETAAYADGQMCELNKEAKQALQTANDIEAKAAERSKSEGARRPDEDTRPKLREPDVIRAEIEDAEETLEQWKVAQEALLDQAACLADDPTAMADAGDLIPLVRDLLTRHLETGSEKDVCPACNSPVGQEALQAQIDWIDGQRAATKARASSSSVRRTKIEARMKEVDEATAEWNAVLASLNAEMREVEIESRASVLAAASLRDVPGPAEMSRSQRNESATKTAEAGVYRELKAACGEAATRLLLCRAEAFAEAVGRYVPENLGRVGISLSDQGRQVLDVGLHRPAGGESARALTLHVLLSDIERVVVECAVARLVAEAHIARRKASSKSTDKPLLVLLDPEDRGWDGLTLIEAMRCWSGFPGQVIVTVPEAPWGVTDSVPEGWTWLDNDRSVSIKGRAKWDAVLSTVARLRVRGAVVSETVDMRFGDGATSSSSSPAPGVREDQRANPIAAHGPLALSLALEILGSDDRQAARRKGKALNSKFGNKGASALREVVRAHYPVDVDKMPPSFNGSGGEIENLIGLIFPAEKRGRKAGVDYSGHKLGGSESVDAGGNDVEGEDVNGNAVEVDAAPPAPSAPSAPPKKSRKPSPSARAVLIGLGHEDAAIDKMTDAEAAAAIHEASGK